MRRGSMQEKIKRGKGKRGRDIPCLFAHMIGLTFPKICKAVFRGGSYSVHNESLLGTQHKRTRVTVYCSEERKYF